MIINEGGIMLGISIYPDKAQLSDIKEYIKLASKYNFKRIFTCLLSVDGNVETIVNEFSEIINYANEHQFEVYVDVAPVVFDNLGLKHGDLEFFSKLGVAGVRLDQGFNGAIEAEMTYNPYGLNVEINMSQDNHLLNTILDFQPRKGKIIGCHNFYPQRYTGLSLEHFISSSKRYSENQVRSAAFITSQTAKLGPWPIMEGLCTLESHRDLAITTQLKHHYALGLIDDIIIGNMFASEEELASLCKLDSSVIDFKINLTSGVNPIEEKIIFEHPHFKRGDVNDYIIRSTMCRITHKDDDNAPHDTASVIKAGAVVIGNNDFGQYKNELQIITKEIEDKELQRNIVGYIDDSELFLLDLLKPSMRFKFSK